AEMQEPRLRSSVGGYNVASPAVLVSDNLRRVSADVGIVAHSRASHAGPRIRRLPLSCVPATGNRFSSRGFVAWLLLLWLHAVFAGTKRRGTFCRAEGCLRVVKNGAV